MDLGTVFGVAGLTTALVSLWHSRTLAEAASQQAALTRTLASLEISMRLSDRSFAIRQGLLETPVALEEYYTANPAMRELIDGVGGIAAALMIRKMLDAFQDIYLLRREGVVTDTHWASWMSAFRPFAQMPSTRALFENASARGGFSAEFEQCVREIIAEGNPGRSDRTGPHPHLWNVT